MNFFPLSGDLESELLFTLSKVISYLLERTKA
jgi:hypothetical protein